MILLLLMIMYIDTSNITKDIFNIIQTILIHLADGRRGTIIYTLCLLNITLIITKYIYKNFEEHIITIVYTVYSIKLRGTLSTTDIISKDANKDGSVYEKILEDT